VEPALPCSEQDAAAIDAKFQALVAANLPITEASANWRDALTYFEANNQPCAAGLLKTRSSPLVQVNRCGAQQRLYLNPLFASTGALASCQSNPAFTCKVTAFDGKILLIYSSKFVPQPAIYSSFSDHVTWAERCGVPSVGALNASAVADGGSKQRKEVIMNAEFRQDSKIAEIAAQIKQRGNVRVLAIAGPTSSGKTTFAHKLSIHLANAGYEAKPLSVDHYYLGIEDQPRLKIRRVRNDIDYDHIESMDVALVNQHLNALVRGESIMAPQYDFKSGNRVGEGHKFELPSATSILVIEGIHALNPMYTAGIDQSLVFKVYISPLTTNLLDDFNAVKTTDHRLLRRMTRDYNFRGYSASHTLKNWEKVRNGEHENIFPHQNNADFVMNSASIYEICVLKMVTEPLLRAVAPDFEQFPKAQALLKMLDLFAVWEDREVPLTALLREFIGNGAFDCH